MDVTNDGEKLIKRWNHSVKQVSDLKRRLGAAELEMEESEDVLCAWLLPDDAKPSEMFCVWYGDSLIGVKKVDGSTSAFVRTRGKSLS